MPECVRPGSVLALLLLLGLFIHQRCDSLSLRRPLVHAYDNHRSIIYHSGYHLAGLQRCYVSLQFSLNQQDIEAPHTFNSSRGNSTNALLDRGSAAALSSSSAASLNTNLSLSLAQLEPFLKIAVPFFKNDATARRSLLSVVGLTLLNSGVSVAFSYISRDFYNALNVRNEELFYEKIELFFGALVIAVPISVFYRYTRERLSIYWREALTADVLDKYYSNRTYYILETVRDIDNPDQRISEDIRRFTSTSLDFFITLFTSVIDLFSFSAILFQIYPPLFVAIIAYAGVGSVITTKLGRSLVSLNYDRLQREADFRFSLLRTRENAEAIAFYDQRAAAERANVWTLFKSALETQLGIAMAQRDLEYFTTSYRYIVQILPSLIVAPLYFANKVELGTISQSYGAFNHILGDFSLIINQFESLSAFAAGLTRLSTFTDRIDGKGWDSPAISDTQSLSMPSKKPMIDMQYRRKDEVPQVGDWLLQCRNLTVLTPDANRVIVGNIGGSSVGMHGIDVNVLPGDRILIVGASGSGKSSFVRAIAGLWQVGGGTIQWNGDYFHPTDHSSGSQATIASPREVFFFPQKPYNVLGSLKAQITYPNLRTPLQEEEDELFLGILHEVRLSGLAARMGDGDETVGLRSVRDWGKVLSLGEQQRLAFARILYNKPNVIVLDEATSALDLASEEAMYALLSRLNATFVSVGHRPSLVRYHSSKLVLYGEGRIPSLVPIPQGGVLDTADSSLVDLTAI